MKSNLDDLLEKITYGYYYDDKYDYNKILQKEHGTVLNCKDSIYEGMGVSSLKNSYNFTLDLLLSQEDENKRKILINELNIIHKYIIKFSMR